MSAIGVSDVVDADAADAAVDAAANLNDKQVRILGYLRDNVGQQTYFKSRLIAEDLGMTAKEVGANMTAICESDVDVDVEKWGYSSGTTWMVTA
ncbi:DUF7123 family protein [Halobaculum sp. D14]|uniref:DUF7123 family protein n=1 Tax=Halobaculum sp. D14 TaxID=3421642 RepID=UPI003EBF435C